MPTLVEFFGVELAERLVADGRRGRPRDRRTTCSRRCPTSTTSSPESRSCSRRAERRRSSFRTSRGCSRACSTTRSTTSTSRTSRCSRSARRSPRTGSPSSTSRSFRATAARSASTSRTHRRAREPSDRGRASVLAREEADGLRDPERYRRFADDVEESKRALLEPADRAPARRQAGRRLRRARARATRCSTTAGSGPISSTTRSTATRTSTGRFTPGTHIPIHPPERIAETRPDVIVILPVEPRAGDRRAARVHGRVGRTADRADSDGDAELDAGIDRLAGSALRLVDGQRHLAFSECGLDGHRITA